MLPQSTLKRAIWRAVRPPVTWWLDRSEGRRLRVLRYVGDMVLPGYRFKHPEIGWWGDVEFTELLRHVGELEGLNTDRLWNVSQLTRLAMDLPGDTAECGVYRGASSYVICRSLRRPHHGFDSFQGLSDPLELDGDHWRRGDLTASEAVARSVLAEFNVTLHPGWIPDRFNDVADSQFAFVHIDVDLYEPTRHSLEFFYPLVVPGGVIVVDDYGFITCPGATEAVDEFLADRSERIVSLASGGGFIIKLSGDHPTT